MNRVVARFTVAAVALALAAGSVPAGAQTSTKSKKVGFFASLFGSSPAQKARKAQRKFRTTFDQNWWWQDDSGGSQMRRQAFYDDPEADPGLGMGNLTFVPEKQVVLGGAVFAEPRPSDSAGSEIYDALADKNLGLRVSLEARDAILAHYKASGFRPLWTDTGTLTPRAQSLLKVLAAAGAEGLDPSNYLPPALASVDAAIPHSDPTAMARLDLGLTAMAVKYARHASGGQFDPRRLSLYNDIVPAWVRASQAMKVLAWSPYPAEYLESLQPRHEAYGAMKQALAGLRKEQNTAQVEPIATGKLVKVGQSDERLPAVRARLAQLGLPGDDLNPPEDALVLDTELTARLKRFQKSAGTKVTGLLGDKTIAALNRQGYDRDIKRLVNNMERLRWLPKDLGRRHVLVNQPAFQVRVLDRGQVIWHSQIIVGKPMTQTAAFHDEIETVVFNPSWGVPQSIVANEYLPKLRDDPGYLDRIGFKVVDTDGSVVSSSSIDWWSYGSKVPYGIQQPPGSDNALGELKFLFPNSHAIYMHDTPNRELFENDERAFSHGCVRVQNPREFAAILLGWNSEKIAANIGSGRSQSVKLAAKVPVHITYFTAWPGETGTMQYFNDIYGRDQAMDDARSAIAVALR